MSRSTRWCFTINNYTPADITRLCQLETRYLIFGREVGENGTPHLQGYVEFTERKRFNSAKAAIGPTAHLETAKGSAEHNREYCSKDGNFEEFGEPAIKSKGKRTDWEALHDWLQDLGRTPSKRELIREFPGLYARYAARLEDIVAAFRPPPRFTEVGPRPGWQEQLHDRLLEGDEDDRCIIFNVDPVGGNGKTWFCRYMLQEKPDDVQYLRIGKRDDLAHAIDETKSIFLIDVPRGQMEYLQYSILEMLKDRLIFSPKYNSRTKVLTKTPAVCVFSNEEPDMDALTSDRYTVINLS